MMSSVTLPLTFCEMRAIKAITASAPMMAETVSARLPTYPRRLNACPPIPDTNTTSATPRLAPELIPSTEGPANGLRKTVCICNPLTERPAPATKAVSACGSLDFRMIFRRISLSSAPSPKRIRTTDRNGISL